MFTSHVQNLHCFILEVLVAKGTFLVFVLAADLLLEMNQCIVTVKTTAAKERGRTQRAGKVSFLHAGRVNDLVEAVLLDN